MATSPDDSPSALNLGIVKMIAVRKLSKLMQAHTLPSMTIRFSQQSRSRTNFVSTRLALQVTPQSEGLGSGARGLWARAFAMMLMSWSAPVANESSSAEEETGNKHQQNKTIHNRTKISDCMVLYDYHTTAV